MRFGDGRDEADRTLLIGHDARTGPRGARSARRAGRSDKGIRRRAPALNSWRSLTASSREERCSVAELRLRRRSPLASAAQVSAIRAHWVFERGACGHFPAVCQTLPRTHLPSRLSFNNPSPLGDWPPSRGIGRDPHSLAVGLRSLAMSGYPPWAAGGLGAKRDAVARN
jgi:hypothetical protein